ncbi:MAG: glycogen synthase GlgA [Gemmataceae bacterium]
MRVLLASSEVSGFAKTGGLADVAGALPRALARRGTDAAVIMPLYRACRTSKNAVVPTDIRFDVPLGGRTVPGRLWKGTLPESNVPVWLVEQADYFDRDDPALKRSLYQYTDARGHKRDYDDNGERFLFFSKAVLAALPLLPHWPDVLHANDWQTGLIPVLLRETTPKTSPYASVRTLFTLHNLAYQGVFPKELLVTAGLPWRLFTWNQLEYFDQLNYLKAGIVFADWLSTVSPSYAREIQTPYFGCGLEGALSERRFRLSGIVNGVDYQDWNPATDRHIAAHYDPNTVTDGKAACKADLQRQLGLPQTGRTPLLGVIARLVEQKGIELLTRCADSLLMQDAQLVVLGEGDPGYQRQLRDLERRHPQRMRATIGFDEVLAHKIEAGADIFLMPSRYEPSGLNQLYSLKYGTPPVVRATGGLADTIVDATEENLNNGTATGFRFAAIAAHALRGATERATWLYRNRPDVWLHLQRIGMSRDWSWDRSAGEYEQVYRQLAKTANG